MTRKAVSRVRAVTTLVLIMAAIGVVTVIATINTFEVIFRHDTSLSDVIIDIELTSDDSYDKVLMSKESQVFDEGHFGTPKKIKFPESRIHYDVTSSQVESSKWKATKGLAHYFVTENPVQKVFGGAVIYMRENTPTTHDIGSIMNGDIINIVLHSSQRKQKPFFYCGCSNGVKSLRIFKNHFSILFSYGKGVIK